MPVTHEFALSITALSSMELARRDIVGELGTSNYHVFSGGEEPDCVRGSRLG
jgi:hypothetical protein